MPTALTHLAATPVLFSCLHLRCGRAVAEVVDLSGYVGLEFVCS